MRTELVRDATPAHLHAAVPGLAKRRAGERLDAELYTGVSRSVTHAVPSAAFGCTVCTKLKSRSAQRRG